MERKPIPLAQFAKKKIDPSKLKRTVLFRCHNRRCFRMYRGVGLFCCKGCAEQHLKDNPSGVVHVEGFADALNAHGHARQAATEPSGCTCGAVAGPAGETGPGAGETARLAADKPVPDDAKPGTE